MGCVSDTYRYGVDPQLGHTQPHVSNVLNPISHGVAHPKVDRFESFVQSPKKLVRKLARRPTIDPADEAHQREEAVDLASDYLAANGLNNVYIDVRVYQPREQWERLKSNSSVRPIWKYTGGTLNWLRYTILPMRAFHSDHYDPFTNTLNLNSTQPAEALYESALAKEFQTHRKLGVGAYALLQYVPFVPLYQNVKASSDVLTFSQHHLDGELSDDLYPLTYSRLGSIAVSETLSVVTLSPNAPIFTGPLLRVAGGTAGRSTGATLARKKDEEENEDKARVAKNPPKTELIDRRSNQQIEALSSKSKASSGLQPLPLSRVLKPEIRIE